jgi:hypothetical protein
MRTIWKYEIPIADKFVLQMPITAKILTTQIQNGLPVMWAVVNTEEKLKERTFYLFGTGHRFPEEHNVRYINTFQIDSFVGHLFEDCEI